MHSSYKSLAPFYDLLFQQKNYTKEVFFINKIVKKYNPRAKSILDVGCGSGTHLNLLKDNFETLFGVDINSEIIKVAKKKSAKISYQQGSMAGFKINQKFDVLLCLYSVFNYNQTKVDSLNTLRNFKKHLNSNGVAIIALYQPTNTDKKISLHTGIKNDTQVAKINQFFTDPKTKTEHSNFLVLIKDKGKINFFVENNHEYRIYTTSEFSELLSKVGFKLLKTSDNFTNLKATTKTKYPVFIIQKT